MKQLKFIYKVIYKFGTEAGIIEKVLNEKNTDKRLINVIETDELLIFVWED